MNPFELVMGLATVGLEALRAQLTEQEDLRQRVLDMEERLDFAERVLAQATHDRLGAGKEPQP